MQVKKWKWFLNFLSTKSLIQVCIFFNRSEFSYPSTIFLSNYYVHFWNFLTIIFVYFFRKLRNPILTTYHLRFDRKWTSQLFPVPRLLLRPLFLPKIMTKIIQSPPLLLLVIILQLQLQVRIVKIRLTMNHCFWTVLFK